MDVVYLPAHTTILMRPRVGIQLGVLPHHAVILPVPSGVAAGHVAQILSLARQPMETHAIIRGLIHCGMDKTYATEAVEELRRARILMDSHAHNSPIYVLDTGINARLTTQALERVGLPHRLTDDPAIVGNNLLLTGGEVFLPVDVHFTLMTHRIAHFPHGLIDGALVIGPLIVPGTTACLRCLDTHYTTQDAQWNSMRAQATAKPNHRSRPEMDTAALAIATLTRDHLAPWAHQHRNGHNPTIPATASTRKIITIGSFTTVEEAGPTTWNHECSSCSIARMDGAVRTLVAP